MSSSDLHHRVIQILYDLCLNTKTDAGKLVYSKVHADHVGKEYRPLVLTAYRGKRRKPLARTYNPDIWAQIKRKRKRDVYEVWHSETEADAIEDILLSCFVDGIRYLHIVCTGANLKKDQAEDLVDFILYKLRDEEGKELLEEEVSIAELPESIYTNNSEIERFLQKELDF